METIKGEAEARKLIDAGDLIGAIKLLRSENGVDLLTAKTLMEKMRGTYVPPVFQSESPFIVWDGGRVIGNSEETVRVVVSAGTLSPDQRLAIGQAIAHTLNFRFGPRA